MTKVWLMIVRVCRTWVGERCLRGAGGVDGSGGSGVFRRMFLVCGGGELLTSFFNGGR